MSSPPLSTNRWISPETRPTDTAGDVVRLAGVRDSVQRVFLKASAPGFRNTLNLSASFEINMRVQSTSYLLGNFPARTSSSRTYE